MATETEINEVKTFLSVHNGEWEDPHEYKDELPEVSKRLDNAAMPIAYHINAVVREAGLSGGVEEHGRDDWLITDGTDTPEDDE